MLLVAHQVARVALAGRDDRLCESKRRVETEVSLPVTIIPVDESLFLFD